MLTALRLDRCVHTEEIYWWLVSVSELWPLNIMTRSLRLKLGSNLVATRNNLPGVSTEFFSLLVAPHP